LKYFIELNILVCIVTVVHVAILM